MKSRTDKDLDEKESKEKEEEHSTDLYKLYGFPHGLPKDIVVTDETKKAFARARLKQGDSKAQGLIGICFLGNSGKTLFTELLAAFNKNDNLPREDKDGVPYKEGESVYSDEPFGGNSGRNHELFIKIIEGRIQEAIDKKDESELEKYAGCYSIVDGRVVLDKTKIFGFGAIKGSDAILLDDMRSNSANINPFSVTYNEEFLLINYFKYSQDHIFGIEQPIYDIDAIFQNEYNLKRGLPIPIAEEIGSALLSQLPKEKDSTERESDVNSFHHNEKFFTEWDQIKDEPEAKMDKLLTTLCLFLLRKNKPADSEIIKIIDLIKSNIKQLESDKTQQDLFLARCLSLPKEICYKDRDKTITATVFPFDLAKKNNYNRIADILKEAIKPQKEEGISLSDYQYEPLLVQAAGKGDKTLVENMLELEPDINVKDKDGNTAIMMAAKKEKIDIDMIKILIEHKADISIKNEDDLGYIDYIYTNIENALSKNDFKQASSILENLNNHIDPKKIIPEQKASFEQLITKHLARFYTEEKEYERTTGAYTVFDNLKLSLPLPPRPTPLSSSSSTLFATRGSESPSTSSMPPLPKNK